ncbi:MAG: peptidoglycan editing factor PgeF [Elainellaceae cyanobacterium]
MHTWTWTQHNELPYLTCSLLKGWSHGFFTQQWWPHLPEAELGVAIASAFTAPQSANPATSASQRNYRVKQIHGNRVLTTAEHHAESEQRAEQAAQSENATAEPTENPPSLMPEADGLIAEANGQTVWVATADCVPALIADTQTGRVAAVHAGWRGTQQKIVPIAVQRLLNQGSQIQNIRVALGPAIAGEVYQVSTTVAAQVGATVLPDLNAQQRPGESSVATSPESHHAVAELLSQVKALPQSPVLDDPQPGRARLDVRRINVLQLEQLGLAPEHVAVAPYCTYQQGDRFFSYRRSRLKKVQWSGIAANEPSATAL